MCSGIQSKPRHICSHGYLFLFMYFYTFIFLCIFLFYPEPRTSAAWLLYNRVTLALCQRGKPSASETSSSSCSKDTTALRFSRTVTCRGGGERVEVAKGSVIGI